MTGICEACGELHDDCTFVADECGMAVAVCYECLHREKRAEAKAEAEYWQGWKEMP